MNDLIDRQAVIDSFDKEEVKVTGRENAEAMVNYLNRLINRIKSIPSEQVQEAYWIEYSKVIVPEPYNRFEQAWKCSECGFGDGFWIWKFCPNCGARMDIPND